MLLLVFYLLLAICVSFLCSVAEAVLLSVRPAFVTTLAKKRSKGAVALRTLRENLDRPLAAILILNTIAHTVGAAGVGAQAAAVFGNNYLGVTSAVLTLLILVLSEIIPKTLGATYWQSLASPVAIGLSWVTWALHPLVWLSEKLTRLIAPKDVHAFTFSRDEMTAMAQIGAEEGLLDEKELRIVRNLMRLHHFQVKDIMSPRAVMFVQSEDKTVEAFFAEHSGNPFSRIPLYREDPEEITGYVLKQDLFVAQARDEFSRTLREFRRDLPAIPDTVSASHAYDTLMRDRRHVMLVVDEYGATRGIVTLEDVVETLFGLEITDELDTETDMQRLARRRWRARMKRMGIDTSAWDERKTP